MKAALWARGSMRQRLTGWNVSVLGLTLLVLGAALLGILRVSLLGAVDRDQARFASAVQRQFAEGDLSDLARRVRHDPLPRPFGPRLWDRNGLPLPPFPPGPAWDKGAWARSLQGKSVSVTVNVNGTPVRVLSVPLTRGGRAAGVLQIARPLLDEYAQMRRVTTALLTLIPLALLVAGVGGAFLTGRALRPVRQMTQAAARVEAEDLSRRLPVTGSDELAELAATFNGMLARLQDAFARVTEAHDRQRQFTADASHELRTPLTAIKAHTSLALMDARTQQDRQMLLAIDRAADRTVRLVQDLLMLARADAGQLALARGVVPVREMFGQAQDALVGPSAPVVIEMPDPDVCVCGDADALSRLVGNLLSNAARHTPSDGCITLRAAANAQTVTVQVVDTGEGIAPEHLPHLGERFYRVDASRTASAGGTGLGLSICREIVQAHGGAFGIESVPGAGTAVTVVLPRA